MHPWVHISHETGTVIPAQQVQVFVTLLVNQPEQSKILTYGTAQLNDILVIRVLNSSDYFVTIDAEWLPSVLGLDIPFLSLLKKPLRSYTVSEYAHLKTQIQSCGGRFSRIFMPETVESDSFDNALDPSIRYSIPKPIWIIIDFIYQMGEPIEMEIKGHHGLYQYLNECLCHGVEISSEIFEDTIQDSDLLPFNTLLTPLCSKNQEILDFELKVKSWKINRATALATGLELLFDFLSAIPEPIIPYSFYNRVLSEGYQSISAAKSLLYQIPTLHYNLFIYLCSFFKQWFKRDKKGTIKANMCNLFSLIIVNKLANILVREPLQSSYMSSENSSTRSKKLAFISHFI
jgi:phosphatidylinositol-bisphosphatase